MNSQNQQIQASHKNPKVSIAQARFNLVYPMVEDKQNTELIYDAFKDNAKWKYNFTDQQKLNYFNHEKKIIVWACIFQTDKDYTQFDDFLMAFYTWLEEKAEFPLEEKKKDDKGSAKKYAQKQPAGNQIQNRQHLERERQREREKERQRERERERERLREEEEKQRQRERQRQRQRHQRQQRQQKQLRERKERAERAERELERERQQRLQEQQRKLEQQQRQYRHQQSQSNRNAVQNHPTRSNPQYQQAKQNMPENRQATQKQEYINKDDFVKKILTKIADIIDLPERKCKSKVQIFASIEELRRLETNQKNPKK